MIRKFKLLSDECLNLQLFLVGLSLHLVAQETHAFEGERFSDDVILDELANDERLFQFLLADQLVDQQLASVVVLGAFDGIDFVLEVSADLISRIKSDNILNEPSHQRFSTLIRVKSQTSKCFQMGSCGELVVSTC